MAIPKGGRWVTIKKEGPLHGRKILIDGKGFVIGGGIPRAFHGRHIGRLAGITPGDDKSSHYDDYSADDLKEIHEDFTAHHENMKKQLHEDLHGMAKGMRDGEMEASDDVNLIKQIRAKGGVNVPDTHDASTDFKESVHPGVRKAISNTKSKMGLDEMADELGMSQNELMDKLSGIEPSKYTKIDDYLDKAKAQMPDYADREKGVEELGKHVDAIAVARKRKEHAAAQEKADAEEAKQKKKAAKKEEPQAGKYEQQMQKLKEKLKGMSYGQLQSAAFKAMPQSPTQQAIRAEMDARQKSGDVPDMYKHKKDEPAGDTPEAREEPKPEEKLNLSDAEKAKKEASNTQEPAQSTENDTRESEKPDSKDTPQVKRRGDKLDDLHDDVAAYIGGKKDANEVLKKHQRLVQAMARNVAAKRGGEAEDLSQEGMTAAYKTLESLKNGSQKPKEGQHLGEHLLRRIKQGLSEGARQQNERPMSRESAKLAALVNSHKQAHLNETGQEPSEDDLFNRVNKDDKFSGSKFAAPGTKTNIEDPREKFNAVRDAMKNQKSQTTLDEGQTDDEGGNMGTKGANLADRGDTPEQAAVRKEAEQEMQARKDQLHGVLGEFGLSGSERTAVAHRFGVGHKDATGAVVPWEKVAEHMSKDLGKKVNPETARKHFHNGRAKLHQHIGDERMGMLMQKSLLEDSGVHLLRKMLYELGVYDILKSQGLENKPVLEPFRYSTTQAGDYVDLIKGLDVDEYVGSFKQWADGSITAQTIKYRIKA